MQVSDLGGTSITYANLGFCYNSLGYFNKALKYFRKSIKISRKLGNRKGEGIHLGSIGICYIGMGDIGQAIKFIEESISIAEEIGDQEGIAASQRRYAYVALLQSNWTDALAYYEKALRIAVDLDASRSQHFVGWGLALVRLYMGDPANARVYIDTALNFDEPENTHNAQTVLGVIALQQRDGSTANDAFTRALAHAKMLIDYADRNYAAWDAKGIALAGLALLATDIAERESHLAGARMAFAKARSITDAAGVVTAVRQLLDALKVADTDGVLGDL
jgi:tetratricopeptide (TPR) repeat protein